MKKKDLPVVHCTYCNTEKSVSEILENLFAFTLAASLYQWSNPLYNVSDE